MSCHSERPLCSGYVKLDCCSQPIWDTFTTEDKSYNQDWLYVEVPCEEVETTTTSTTTVPPTTTTTTSTTTFLTLNLTVINNSSFDDIAYQLDEVAGSTKVNGYIDSGQTKNHTYTVSGSTVFIQFKAYSFFLVPLYIDVDFDQTGAVTQTQQFPGGTVSFQFTGGAGAPQTTVTITDNAITTTTTTSTTSTSTTSTTTTTTSTTTNIVELWIANNAGQTISFASWEYGVGQGTILPTSTFPHKYVVNSGAPANWPIGTYIVHPLFKVIHDGYPVTYVKFNNMSNTSNDPIRFRIIYTPAGGSPSTLYDNPALYPNTGSQLINVSTPGTTLGLTDLVEVHFDIAETTTTTSTSSTSTTTTSTTTYSGVAMRTVVFHGGQPSTKSSIKFYASPSNVLLRDLTPYGPGMWDIFPGQAVSHLSATTRIRIENLVGVPQQAARYTIRYSVDFGATITTLAVFNLNPGQVNDTVYATPKSVAVPAQVCVLYVDVTQIP